MLDAAFDPVARPVWSGAQPVHDRKPYDHPDRVAVRADTRRREERLRADDRRRADRRAIAEAVEKARGAAAQRQSFGYFDAPPLYPEQIDKCEAAVRTLLDGPKIWQYRAVAAFMPGWAPEALDRLAVRVRDEADRVLEVIE
jgi:hypothetical protein